MINKKVLKTLIILIIIIVFSLSVYAVCTISSFFKAIDNTPFIKGYTQFTVEEGQVVDYTDFDKPQGKCAALLEISESVRFQLSSYMKKNDFKLKPGEYEFGSIGSTYEGLLKTFEFEKMSK